ncbi:hypothetical protein [Pleionea sediminis]|uniref:hypothetical protein n=1 Tax=Pleionea sediminis TaxID=2569479 RepID=UPI0011856E23|nr:hypothetical protein [Pleionea sediminis]
MKQYGGWLQIKDKELKPIIKSKSWFLYLNLAAKRNAKKPSRTAVIEFMKLKHGIEVDVYDL